ncbi:MAG: TIGR04141 family sporadically distributed protein [Phytoplasma sp.]|uniref:DUF6119 family protein n=1 Tax=Phytoplasma sp. TaxID=2155 RepID=UPI002B412537|nr:DUF6119 family protein [Phytoplasma sp.]WRH06745.1 MAG: TIGR04141 family sporadically distributed protein [Phytoplasma sp.]
MIKNNNKEITINLFLLKTNKKIEDAKEFQKLLLRNKTSNKDKYEFNLNNDILKNIKIYYQIKKDQYEKQKLNDWEKYLGLGEKDKLNVADKRDAIILIQNVPYMKDKERFLAITFGTSAYYCIKEYAEAEFGIITLLNLIDDKKLKKAKFTSVYEKKTKQIESFGSNRSFSELEIQYDYNNLLPALEGFPKTYHLTNKPIYGNYNFKLKADTTKYPLNKLHNLCKCILSKYNKAKAEEKFEYLFNFTKILNKDEIEKLNTKLFEQIFQKTNNGHEIEITTMEFDKNSLYSNDFYFTLNNKPEIEDKIYENSNILKLFRDFFNKKFPKSDKEKIKKLNQNFKKIYILRVNKNDSTDTDSKKIMECILFKTNKNILLFKGNWLEINSKYIEKITKKLLKIYIDKFDFLLKKEKDKNHEEGVYINKIIEHLDNKKDQFNYILSHKKSLYIKDGDNSYSKFEICDILGIPLDSKHNIILYHVKNLYSGYNTSQINHLSFQSFFSHEIINHSDLIKNFDKNIIKQIKSSNKKIKLTSKQILEKFRNKQITINYLIIFSDKNLLNKKKIIQNMPFPSKLSLFENIKKMEQMGTEIEISVVKIEE